jgi:hypothetical protein
VKEIIDEYGDAILATIGGGFIMLLTLFIFFSSKSPFFGVISNFLPF